MKSPRTNKEAWKNKWQGRTEPVNEFAKAVIQGAPAKGELLDVGCGNGTDSFFFVENGFTVTAVDFSESGIEGLNAAAKERGLSIRSSVGDISKKLPYKDESFDVVYAHLSLHYFDDATTKRVFAEMHRVLKKGGYFFVKCKSVDDPLYGVGEEMGPDIFRSDHTRHFFSLPYLKSMLGGFAVFTSAKSSSAYHGKVSNFVQAVAQK